MAKILFLIIAVVLIVGQVVVECKTRPPLNSDFVNGPWARIGKRARANKECGAESMYKLDILDKLSVSQLNMLISCIKQMLNEKNAYDDDEKNEGNLSSQFKT